MFFRSLLLILSVTGVKSYPARFQGDITKVLNGESLEGYTLPSGLKMKYTLIEEVGVSECYITTNIPAEGYSPSTTYQWTIKTNYRNPTTSKGLGMVWNLPDEFGGIQRNSANDKEPGAK